MTDKLTFIVSIKNKIIDFISAVDIYSVQYLGWISAIIAALLALTTIIFSQHNERVLQRSNDLAQEIQLEINMYKDKVDMDKIIIQFNSLISLLINVQPYEKTLSLFKFISYSLIVCWIFAGLGYAYDAKSNSDVLIIIAATIILIIPLAVLPNIMSSFNKSKPVKINQCITLDELIAFFVKANLKKEQVIQNLLQPNISISLTPSNLIRIVFQQAIPTKNYSITLRLVADTGEIIFLHLTPLSSQESIYITSSSTETTMYINFTSMFKKIKDSNVKECKAYILSETEEAVFSLNRNIEGVNSIEFTINNKINQPIILPIKDLSSQQKSLVKFESKDETLQYELNNK